MAVFFFPSVFILFVFYWAHEYVQYNWDRNSYNRNFYFVPDCFVFSPLSVMFVPCFLVDNFLSV